MARRVFLWLAVLSLCGLGVSNAVTGVIALTVRFGVGGWASYSPSSSQSLPFPMRLMEFCSYADMVFVPLAALSAAAYMILLDRAISRGVMSHGFDVRSAASAEVRGTSDPQRSPQ